MAKKQIIIICGEASGDLHAGNLAKAIRQIDPDIKISGVGGQVLRSFATEIYCDIKDLSVMGLFDVLKKLPAFFKLKKLILKKIKSDKPDAIIFVDFSGFNLRLAKEINNSIPTIYYVSPQVWASRQGRVETIKKYISKMIVLFKFEQEFYKKHGLDVDFVGHPLLDIISPSMEIKELLNNLKFSASIKTIALLPGSRKQEVKKILPIMLEASRLINNELKCQFVIAKSPQVNWEIYNRIRNISNLETKIVEGKAYDCLNIADFALVASGTATLETAIMQVPFFVIYKMGLLNYLLYRPQVKLPYIGMVNIVAGRKIIPEFIQFKACPKNIADEALNILKDHSKLQEMQNNLAQIKSSLGENGASLRAAQIILNFLNK